MHPSLLHDRTQLWIISAPFHIPHIGLFKLQRHAWRSVAFASFAVEEAESTVDVDDGKFGSVAVCLDHLRPAVEPVVGRFLVNGW